MSLITQRWKCINYQRAALHLQVTIQVDQSELPVVIKHPVLSACWYKKN